MPGSSELLTRLSWAPPKPTTIDLIMQYPGYRKGQVKPSFYSYLRRSETAGVLTDSAVDGGEQVAMMELFKGAIGLFKNPSSHREVRFEDITIASEVVLLADLLMQLLDEREARLTPVARHSR